MPGQQLLCVPACLSLALFISCITAAAAAATAKTRQIWQHQQPSTHNPLLHTSLPDLSSPSLSTDEVHNERLHGHTSAIISQDDSAAAVTLARPYIVPASTVRGPVSAGVQAQLEAEEQLHAYGSGGGAWGPLRGLLHGPKKPRKYPKCGACRIVRCSRVRCSGHCRKNRKLHDCDDRNIAPPEPEREEPPLDLPPGGEPAGPPEGDGDSPACVDDRGETLADVQGLPPDSIADYDTVVVTAEAPYIGCANIGNRPSGCPAPGTRATLPGGREVTVTASFCRTEYYVPDCGSPLLPFGVCECFYRDLRVSVPGGRGLPLRITRTACSTTELEARFGVGGADGSPSDDDLVVRPSGDLTKTWFSDFLDPKQQPAYSYSVNASVRAIDVDVEVSLDVYPGLIVQSAFVKMDSDYDISEDYDYD